MGPRFSVLLEGLEKRFQFRSAQRKLKGFCDLTAEGWAEKRLQFTYNVDCNKKVGFDKNSFESRPQ